MWVRPLAKSDAACGGKAVGLARLIAAGLPVPDGIVLDDRAFHAAEHLPRDLIAEVEAAVAALAGPLAVRSSATIEDSTAGAAAGVFSSRTAVAPDDVWPAIRAVWASAVTPLAATYARERGAGPARIGVILQRFIAGEPLTIYTRPPGEVDGDELWLQQGGTLERRARSSPGEAGALALAAERAIGVEASGADVELVDAGGRLWIVQARPIAHPPPARHREPAPPMVLAPLRDGRTWTWDVTHNPDPLSPAQAALVERVERAGVAPWSLRVCGGYLYTAPRERPAAPPLAELPRIEAALAAALGEDRDLPLDEAIDRYVAFYRIWANELSPLIAAARGGAPSSPGAAALLAAARGELTEDAALAQVGVLAPAWDVAVPTFAERPALVRDAIARARLVTSSGSNAEDLGDLGERDDIWFARAQWLVRRAILARGRALAIDLEDACWLAPDELAHTSAVDARRRASGARAAAARAAGWGMPLVVGEIEQPPAMPQLHGIGVGVARTVTGRVVRFASLASAIVVGKSDVIVTRAVTPALAVFVVGCAALVSETGGPLDHGAALARELGIPCVVGCRDAFSRLSDGMLVSVDAANGVVQLAAPAASSSSSS
jgi:phosphohistidine swiveling domain-containing protein